MPLKASVSTYWNAAYIWVWIETVEVHSVTQQNQSTQDVVPIAEYSSQLDCLDVGWVADGWQLETVKLAS